MSKEHEGAGIPITAIHINLKDRSITLEAEGQTVARLTLAPEGVIFEALPAGEAGYPNQESQQDESPEEIPTVSLPVGPLRRIEASRPRTVLVQGTQAADRPNSKERKTVVLTGKLVEKPKKGKPDRSRNPTARARFAAHVEGEDKPHDYYMSFHRHTRNIALSLDKDAQITVDGYPHPSDSPDRLDTFSVFNIINYPGKPKAREERERPRQQAPTQQADRGTTDEEDSQPIPGTNLTTETAWNQTLEKLKEKSGQPAYEAWLKDTRLLGFDNDTAIIQVPTPFAQEWLERRLYRLMVETFQEVVGKDTVDIQFTTPS